MLTIGLTGGIASGKSYCQTLFANYGIEIIDADKVSRDVVRPGSFGLSRLVQTFGPEILSGGALNRAYLRRLVFADDRLRLQLNAIMHPLIHQAIEQWLLKSCTSPYRILSAALLIENKVASQVDAVLLVDVDEKQQLQRAMRRDQQDEEALRAVIRAQCSRSERLQAAHFVIDNTCSKENTRIQVDLLHRRFIALAAYNNKNF